MPIFNKNPDGFGINVEMSTRKTLISHIEKGEMIFYLRVFDMRFEIIGEKEKKYSNKTRLKSVP